MQQVIWLTEVSVDSIENGRQMNTGIEVYVSEFPEVIDRVN